MSALRRRDALHNWTLHFGPNMTPMVDVVMVILVFFMASAAFLGPEWFLKALVPVEPPEGAGSVAAPTARKDPVPPPRRIEITLDLDPRGTTVATGAGKAGVSVDEIGAALAAEARGLPGVDTAAPHALEVLIRPAARVPYRDVVRVHEAAQRAGITRVGVGLRDGPVGPPSVLPSGSPR